MLVTTDLVKVAYSGEDKAKKGKTEYFGTFDRIYLSKPAEWPTESESVEFETTDGKQSVTVVSPKKDGNGIEVNGSDLFDAAIAYLTEKQNNEVPKEEDRIDPTILLLQYADDGLVSALRMKKRNEIVPREINHDKALLNHAKSLVALGKFKSVDAAMEAMKSLGLA